MEKNVKKKNPKKHLSDLTMYDKSLGESWLNVKNHSMDNTQLLRQLLVDLGVETSKNVDINNYKKHGGPIHMNVSK